MKYSLKLIIFTQCSHPIIKKTELSPPDVGSCSTRSQQPGCQSHQIDWSIKNARSFCGYSSSKLSMQWGVATSRWIQIPSNTNGWKHPSLKKAMYNCTNANHFCLTSHRIAKLLKFISTSTHVASSLGRFFSMSRLLQTFWQQPVWQTQGSSDHEFSVSRFYELIRCNFSYLSMNL